jgi:nitroreductase
MEVLEAIHARRSVRSFRDEDVPDETIETLLRAAMAAPSANNGQRWRFVVVRDPAVKAHLAAPAGKAPAGRAPVDIVVLGDTSDTPASQPWWAFDCALAIENLMLAAVGEGLGTVWLAGWPNDEWAANTKAAVGAPDHLIPVAVIAVGVPEGPPAQADRYRADRVHHDTCS